MIVGGGFGGLSAAKALRKAPVKVVLIDRNNHHTFQPLLYQVATAVLSPGQIGSPLREILRKSKNTTVLLGNVSGIDTASNSVSVDFADRTGVKLSYDYLIVAAGVENSYFGHDEFAKYAPGLKNLADADCIRNRILAAFEQAEAEENPTVHQELLTFVLVGAGPTGVEMASAIAVMVRNSLEGEFRRIDPKSTKIILVDRGERPLATFSSSLSKATGQRLQSLGVELLMRQNVDAIDETGLTVAGKRIASRTIIWTAGVTASPLAKCLNAPTTKAGKIQVKPDLTMPDRPEIFIVGDMASLNQNGQPLPGVAQVAIQQGRYAAKVIQARAVGAEAPKPFRYFDKGNLAVVGRNFAVLDTGKVRLSGFLAWIIWATVHLLYLGQASLELSVFVQWMWTYVTGQRGSRVIVSEQCE
jgi:NADH dehydrogenase FAD-containing subunit